MKENLPSKSSETRMPDPTYYPGISSNRYKISEMRKSLYFKSYLKTFLIVLVIMPLISVKTANARTVITGYNSPLVKGIMKVESGSSVLLHNAGFGQQSSLLPAAGNSIQKTPRTYKQIIEDIINSLDSETYDGFLTINPSAEIVKAPTVVCPGDLGASADQGLCSALVSGLSATYSNDVTILTWDMTGATIASSPATGINNLTDYNLNVGITNITYTATDAGGISVSCSFTVEVFDTQPPTIVCPPTATIVIPNCSSFATGVVLTPPAYFDNCQILNITNNAPAQFPVGNTPVIWIANDVNGLVNSCKQIVNVIRAPAMIISFTTQPTSCFGGNNGTATANVTNGTPPYSYSWNTVPVQTTQTASNLAAGIYIVTVTDADGCIKSAPVTITGPAAALQLTTTQTNVSCFGGNNGTATAIPTGGTAPYTYSWNSTPVQTSITATGLVAGTYTVTVTDANLCVSQATLTITEPASALSVTTTQTNVNCFSGNNGTATAIPAGGTAPYSYSWNTTPVQTTITATGLTAGTYIVTVSDANLCTAKDTVIITAPASALLVTTSHTNIPCFGGNTGTATAIPTGGTAPYTYSWNTIPVQTTITITGLVAGIYTVTVTDANLCTFPVSVTITQPAALTVSTSQINVSCFGGTNGSATAIPSGGTPPYTYLWNTLPPQSTSTATGLTTGTYTVTVTDANLCTTPATVIITQPASALAVTTSQTNVSCFGGSNGSATAIPTGGTAPYTYSWNTIPVQTTITATGLVAGTYTVTVTDANLCTFPATVIITEPAAELSVTISHTDVNCLAPNNGTATAIPAGGTAPYTYSWNTIPVQTTITATGLAAGTYTVTVTDANLCTTQATVTIIAPPPLTVTTSQTNVSCFAGNNGTATAIPAGGAAPYTYSWNTIPVQTTVTATGLTVGTYIVTVTDAGLCTASATVIISGPSSALTVTFSQTAVSCSGGTNGTATAIPSGGNAPYTYSWNTIPSQTTATATGLSAGTYTVTVTDANLCSVPATVIITEPAVLSVATSQTNVNCFGGNNGTATAIPSGGTAPYTYSWNTIPVQTTATASGLVAGTYTVTVTDANLCTSPATVIINGPANALSVTTSSTNVSCFGANNGTATAIPTGGIAPYTYLWNTIPVQTTVTATGLTPGTYTVIVTDANLCFFPATVIITEPAVLSVTTTLTTVSCFAGNNGAATAIPAGGTAPYTFSWNTIPIQTTATATGLTAGTYTVTITDANLCTTFTTVNITEPALALTVSTTQTDVSCLGGNNGSATAIPAGGTAPYTYSWNTIPVQTSITATGLIAGTYTVTVTDFRLCTSQATVIITQPADSLIASVDSYTNVLCFGQSTGSAVASATGGVLPYSFSWNSVPVQITATASNLVAGTYIVTVGDAAGCSDTASVIINQPGAALSGSVFSNVPEDCAGNANGSVTITGNDGTPPYQYSLDGITFQVSGVFNNLTAGSYTVTVRDTNNCTVPVPFEIAVSGVLLANDDFYTTAENTPVSGNVMTNDLGLCNPPVFVTSNTTPANGSVSMLPDGSFIYSPGLNYNGSDQFDYTITDFIGGTSTATVFITISAVNNPPVTFNEYDTLVFNTTISGNVLANGDYDPDGTALTVNTTPVVNASNGTFFILADGSYVYIPNLNYIGNDMIVVSVCDEGIPLPSACTNDTIFILVLPPNQPPVTVNENITICQAASFTGTVFNGDTDPENNLPLTANLVPVVGPAHGNFAIVDPLTGTFIYVPDSAYTGPDMVVVSICDSGTPVECSNDTIFITVIPTIFANAGPSQKLCNADVTFLIGNNPAPGTGKWSFVSGPNLPVIFPPTGSIAIAAGLIASPIPYVFSYTITSPNGCLSTDTISVINYNPPTPSYAGIDQEICDPSGSLTLNLAANTPVFGAGFWSQLSGPNAAVIAINTDPNTSVSGLTFGTYVFQWTVSNGICQISTSVVNITISAPATVYSGPDDTICEGSTVPLNSALASNYSSLLWSSTGTGIFSDPTIQNPVYTPSITDITNGLIVLTLTANGNAPCPVVSDPLTLLINHNVLLSAGPDTTICEGTSLILNGASAQNQDSLLWTTTGLGTLSGETTLNPSYTSALNETGDITFVLTGFASAPCINVSDTVVLHIIPAAIVSAGPNDTICEGSAFTVTGASASQNTGLLWTTSGTGSFNDSSILNPAYTPGIADITNGFVNLTLTAIANVPCASPSATMTLLITRSPIANAGPDTTICQNSSFTVTMASATFSSSVNWISNGAGLLTDINTLQPTYTPAAAETGDVTLTLTALGNYPCGTAVDSMVIHLSPATSAFAGPDSTICEGLNYQLSLATAGINTGLLWTTTGTGTFSDTSILNPVYTPGISDITAGSVNLILTAFGTYPCANQADTMTLTITRSPLADAGPDTTICQISSFTVTMANAPFSSSVGWTSSGTGLLTDINTLQPTYTPAAAETGDVTLTLTAFGNYPCGSAVDSMVIHLSPATSAFAGPDSTICEGLNYQLSLATAGINTGLQWTTTGTGTFSDSAILNPVYTPGISDITAGSVNLILTAFGTYPCANQADTMTLTITRSPLSDAGPDTTICQISSFTVTMASATFSSSVGWTSSGTGLLTDINTLQPTYTPAAAETGDVTLTLTAFGNYPCGTAVDSMVIHLSPATSAFAGPDSTICEGLNYQLSLATAGINTGLHWTTTGTGTFSDTAILNPVYTPGISDITAGSVNLILTAFGTYPCANQADTMTLIITPGPTADAGPDFPLCQGDNIALSGNATNQTSVLWSTSGTGTFSSYSTLFTTYTPGPGETGIVTLTLTAFGNPPCDPSHDDMLLTITPLILADAGPNFSLCNVNATFLVGNDPLPGTGSWSFVSGPNVPAVFPPTGSVAIAAGMIASPIPYVFKYTIVNNGCSSFDTDTITNFNPPTTANAGPDQSFCDVLGDGTTTLAANTPVFGTGAWTQSAGPNTAVITDPADPNTTVTGLTFGSYTFRWTISNGNCTDSWDDVNVLISSPATVYAGENDTICEGSTLSLSNALASNYVSLLWSSTGTGTFSERTIQNPVYKPSAADINTGAVVLTLTATANTPCPVVSSFLTLIINRTPLVYAGADIQLCQGDSYTISDATVLNDSTFSWTVESGTGILTNETTIHPTYTPGPGETGDVTIILSAYAFSPCLSVNDTMTIHYNPTVTVSAGSNASNCEDTPFLLSGSSATGNSGLLWTTSGSGSFSNNSILHPVYSPGPEDVAAGSVTLTLTAFGFDPCPDLQSSMVLTISRQAIAYAGPDGSECEGNTYIVLGASAQNNASISWTHNGIGTLTGVNTLNPIYTPATGETGIVTLVLTATAYSPCPDSTDSMTITIQPSAMANAGPDAMICENSTDTLSYSSVSGNTSLLWTTSGDGTFNDPAILHPIYTPGANDITIGYASLTITAHANFPCEDKSDVMTLVITRRPIVEAGPDIQICQGDSYTLSGTSAVNSTSLLWTTSNGTGTITNANTLIPTYIPASGETGSIILQLTATGNSPCNPSVDSMLLTIIPAVQVYAGPDDTICEGSSFKLTEASVTNNLSLEWSTSGTGSFDDATSLNAVYTPGSNDIAIGFVTLTITAFSNNACPTAVDQMKLFISGYPTANAGQDVKICQGVSFTVSGATASNYSSIKWTTDGSGILTNPGTLTPTYIPASGETGVIKLFITAYGNPGCGIVTAFDYLELTITETVIANAGIDVTIPPNSAIQLHGSATGGSGLYQYNWMPADQLTFETTEIPTTLPLSSDTRFILLVTDVITGCTGIDSVFVFMSNDENQPPVAVDDYDTTDFQTPVTINVLANDSDPENSVLHISFCGYPSNGLVTANSDGSITYTPYAGFSGDDQFCYFICDNGIPVLCDTASVYIHVLPVATIENVFVYNGFSPNGDGNNDFLVIKGIEGFPENEIFIYNRYGDKIRALSHYNNHDVIWDGSNTDGKPVPDGTYFYVLKIKDQPAKTGWIFIRGKK